MCARSGHTYLRYANPSMDTTLRGGDKVIVREDSRSFLALGAAGSEKTHFFEKDRISALDAMAMMGGVSDTRGNPSGILVLRRYASKAVRNDGKGPSNTRAVFVLDLTSADGLFSAGEFEINPNDVVLATESPVNSVQTVFRLIGSAFAISANL
jgi:polysaccharide biosynthesis/export protein